MTDFNRKERKVGAENAEKIGINSTCFAISPANLAVRTLYCFMIDVR